MGRATVRIKQKPEDFSVKESYRFDRVKDGRHRVYLMDKQKMSTFEAVDRLQQRFGLKPGTISYCGLKDKQGRTEQLIAVDGHDIDMQENDLRLKPLGRTDAPLSAANITSNRFSVTVRDLREDDLPPLHLAAAEVGRLGVINYFDSQRFGSLKHGQGFIAKDLLRGDFEAALRNYLAKPSPLDRTEDAKVKRFWSEHWGEWDARVPYKGAGKYHRVLRSLRSHPGDYARAFMQIDAAYRAMQLFTYQSYLWNEGVRRYLQLRLERADLFPAPYQAGSLLFHRSAPPDLQRELRQLTFPLLAHNSVIDDPVIDDAVRWSLGKEKLKLADLKVPGVGNRLFFKHEERPILVDPGKLVLGRVQRDELNRGALKINVAFTLPPGAYATLVIKRLFHYSWHEETREDVQATQDRMADYAARQAAAAADIPEEVPVWDRLPEAPRTGPRPSRPARPGRTPARRPGSRSTRADRAPSAPAAKAGSASRAGAHPDAATGRPRATRTAAKAGSRAAKARTSSAGRPDAKAAAAPAAPTAKKLPRGAKPGEPSRGKPSAKRRAAASAAKKAKKR